MTRKPILLRLVPEMLDSVDAYAKRLGVARSVALVSLIGAGLDAAKMLARPPAPAKDMSITLDQFAKTVIKPAMVDLKRRAKANPVNTATQFRDATLDEKLAAIVEPAVKRYEATKGDLKPGDWGYKPPPGALAKQPKKGK